MSRSKNTKRRYKLFGKSFRLWQLGLIVIAVFFVGFLLYESYLDQKDRQKFDEIEYTIDTLTSRLESEFGIAGEYDNYCYESSEKYTTGPTICVYQKKYPSSPVSIDDIVAFTIQQDDLIGWYDSVINDLDFRVESDKFTCSVDRVENFAVLAIECSDEARNVYYSFR